MVHNLGQLDPIWSLNQKLAIISEKRHNASVNPRRVRRNRRAHYHLK